MKAKLDGVSRGSVALLNGQINLKKRGLRIAESLLEPDGEHCVRIPIENVSCESVYLESRVLLGQIEPVTVVTEPEAAIKQMTGEEEPECIVSQVTGDSPSELSCPTARSSKLIESVHVEESLSTDQARQLRDLILEFADVFALDPHELGTTDLVTHVIDTSDCSPIKQPPRRIPFALREKVD